jgi:DNA-binding GntR family transcriptional regulator
MPIPTEISVIDRRSARHAVFEQLVRWIEEGFLEPGEPIKDSEIATRFGVSRTPVREALQMLEHRGAVEMLPGRMTRVTAVSPQDVALLYGPLSALQAFAAEMGTASAQEHDVERMKQHNERLAAAVDARDAVSARDADRAFHDVLVRLAANPYLLAAIEPLQFHARRLEALYFRDTKPGKQSYEEHRRIIDAVASGDAQAASQLTRQNFTRFWTPPPKGHAVA